MDSAKILLVGFGPQARVEYLPALQELSRHLPIAIVAVCELESEREDVTSHLRATGLHSVEQIFVTPPVDGALTAEAADKLDKLVREDGVNAVIISTEPLAHKAYALWALRHDLDVLMDKPVTTHRNLMTDSAAAHALWGDYCEILSAYRETQLRKKTIFSINVQRRFHAGFMHVEALVRTIADKTGCPPTSIVSTHCDGQWRLPAEFIDIEYHGYTGGYGKLTHSGYHICDLVYRLVRAGAVRGKWPDCATVYARLVPPTSYLQQVTQEDHLSLFGPAYHDYARHSADAVATFSERAGEMDAAIMVSFEKDGHTLCTASITLLHNSYSNRSSLRPAADLWRKNGRVKHQYHSVQQGPFQNVQVHAFRVADPGVHNPVERFAFGGVDHFDMHVFRNPLVTPDGQTYRQQSIQELLNSGDGVAPLSLGTDARMRAVREFIEFVTGSRERQPLSNVDDHEVPVKIMSAAYLSHCQRLRGEDPLVKFHIPALPDGLHDAPTLSW